MLHRGLFLFHVHELELCQAFVREPSTMQCLLCAVTLLNVWLLPSAAGDCGYPGQPLNGLEDILFNTNQVANRKFGNGTSAEFRCSDLHLMVGENVRTCQSNGTWSNAVPQCTTNVADRIHLEADNLPPHSENVSALIDGYDNNCHVQFQVNTSLRISLRRPTRIYAIKLISYGSDETFLSRAKWSVTLANHSGPSVAVEGKTRDHGHYLIVFDRNVSDLYLQFLVVQQVESASFNLCEMEIHAFQDECGHPEMPANGRYLRANNTVTYFCNEGYRLSSDSPAIRYCSRGIWSGQQPTCTMSQIAAVPANKMYIPALIGILIGAGFIAGSAVLIYLRKRKKSKGMVAYLMNNEVCMTHSLQRESTPLSIYNRL